MPIVLNECQLIVQICGLDTSDINAIFFLMDGWIGFFFWQEDGWIVKKEQMVLHLCSVKKFFKLDTCQDMWTICIMNTAGNYFFFPGKQSLAFTLWSFTFFFRKVIHICYQSSWPHGMLNRLILCTGRGRPKILILAANWQLDFVDTHRDTSGIGVQIVEPEFLRRFFMQARDFTASRYKIFILGVLEGTQVQQGDCPISIHARLCPVGHTGHD